MKDSFYMSDEVITTEQIRTIVTNLDYTCSSIPSRQDDWIEINSDKLYVTWDFVDDQKATFPLEPDEQAKYDTLKVQTLVIVSFYTKDFQEVVRILHAVLSKLGGWVACDDDWENFSDIDTILNLQCQ